MISPWDAWPKSLFSWVKDSYGSGMGIVWVPLTIRGSHVLGGPWKFSLIELSHFPPKKVTALVLQGSLWSNNSSGDQSLTRGSANRCHLWQRNKVCKCSCDSLIFWWVMDVIIFLGGDGFQFKYFVCSPLFGEKHIYIYPFWRICFQMGGSTTNKRFLHVFLKNTPRRPYCPLSITSH